jgi:hypothetical protein
LPLKAWWRLAAVFGGCFIAACDAVGVSERELEGEWLYASDNLVSSDWHCSIQGMSLQLSQEGRDFSGSASGGKLNCVRADSTILAELGSRPVINGRIFARDSIRFFVGTDAWEHRGLMTTRSISGVTRFRSSFVEGVELSGSFGAARIE